MEEKGMESKVYTVQEVAEYFQVSQQLIYRLLRAGILPGVQLGRIWRIREDDLNKWDGLAV